VVAVSAERADAVQVNNAVVSKAAAKYLVMRFFPWFKLLE